MQLVEAKELVIGLWRLDYLAALVILALSTCSLFRTRMPSDRFKTWKDVFWNQLFVNCINSGVPLLLFLK